MASDLVIMSDIFLQSNYVGNTDWLNLSFGALLFRTDIAQTLIPANISTIRGYTNVAQYLTPGVEISSTGYVRSSTTPTALQPAALHVQAFPVADGQISFGNPVGDTGAQQDIEGMLLYIVQTNDNDHIPVVFQEYPTTRTTANGPLNLSIPNMLLFDKQQVAPTASVFP